METLKKIYLVILDTLQTILLAVAIFLFIYFFLFRPFQVSGESMFPTFKDKEYILTDLISLTLNNKKLNRGDVIVFHAPLDPEKDYIKRVIGLPGDRILLKDGDVYVNGVKLDESAYLHGVKTYGGAFLKENQAKIVPEGSYFVMGDNRMNSSDSREWGFVDTKKLIGKSFFVYWPTTEMEIIKNPYTSTQ